MLGLSRRDVLSYLAEKKLAWREDSTNADTLYFRNRVRHRLVPALAENFPGWRSAVCAFAKTQSLAADFIVGEANFRVKWRPVQADSGSTRQNAPALCTSEGNFFAQPEIIREEALFQGIDLLFSGALPGSGGVKVAKSGVKRSNIRLFSQGRVTHIDLGGLHLQRKAGMVSICRRGQENTAWESGFSLLIIAGGSYNLKGTVLSVETESVASLEADASACSADKAVSSIAGTAGRGEPVFFALLPFVLRPAFKEDRITCAWHGGVAKAAKTGRTISAVDSLGIAAFIGTDGLLESRRTAAGFKAALDSEGADLAICQNLAVCTVKIGKQKELET
jgi:tRNA(Ile)-lysidine synthase